MFPDIQRQLFVEPLPRDEVISNSLIGRTGSFVLWFLEQRDVFDREQMQRQMNIYNSSIDTSRHAPFPCVEEFLADKGIQVKLSRIIRLTQPRSRVAFARTLEEKGLRPDRHPQALRLDLMQQVARYQQERQIKMTKTLPAGTLSQKKLEFISQ